MSKKYLVEVANAKRRGPAYVHADNSSGVLFLDEDSRVPITAEQFAAFSFELEAKAEGKKGCAKEVRLYATDPTTGESMPISFDDAKGLFAQRLIDDEAALTEQAKQAAELNKLADDRDEEEREADAVDAAQAVPAS